MNRRLSRLKAKDYRFHDGANSRDVIAIFAGGRPVAFIEYGQRAYDLVNKIHDLAEHHEQRSLHE